MLDLNNMTKADFFYDLPQELIAQHPAEPRNSSRLMKIDRVSGEIEHAHFYNLCSYLKKGDLLVLNDSRVLPARIYGEREDTGSFIEFLLLEQRGNDEWEILCRPGKKAKIGTRFVFGEGKLTAEITDVLEDGNRVARFEVKEGNIFSTLDEIGQMPLPPYITEKLEDKERYQTVYSHEVGSSAAPTAGLHFTKEMLREIEDMGVNIAYVTLHVGLGTFRPVKEDKVLDHKMHSEHYEIPERTAELIKQTKANGGRVIAVGTTSCRTLESAAQKYGEVIPCEGRTEIFIYPGFEFKVLDGLVTNFHLPESTLIMLVSAFLGYEKTMNAYKVAVEEKYRFFSFGDAMLIAPDTES
ncbi:S-adenosylmethionine:tRNA ribosyltransferase-isomerase [Ruminococcus sp. YE71]|uniref:tRNA preQ1(34) S-adenosylmethionine ribosyltransferase-isomerase QueA n=1 Tax=unclassified Ruminococcus TaxID=2608920 RepID=UPI00088AB7FD|nr:MULTISPECIES: tRNA preQ1(34) S-adenosylmethionine ribosyltransferase-isomerase QueA [unclassified Ruminococcus]SDA24131.1 S-adenosylmethionine:tRNA ribosyltransferase-isomerase [Ruminococcus sp. YE78]SFW41344.1 S-adenosylmethionine:tRNA ribosyltransferase-isomerase [Ruminococcus sp. YE71]